MNPLPHFLLLSVCLSVSLDAAVGAASSDRHFQSAGKEGRGDEENVSAQGEVSCRQGFRWKLSHRIQFSPSLGPYRCETTGRSPFPAPKHRRVWRILKPLPPQGNGVGGKGGQEKEPGVYWGVPRGLRDTSIF